MLSRFITPPHWLSSLVQCGFNRNDFWLISTNYLAAVVRPLSGVRWAWHAFSAFQIESDRCICMSCIRVSVSWLVNRMVVFPGCLIVHISQRKRKHHTEAWTANCQASAVDQELLFLVYFNMNEVRNFTK